MTEHKFTDEEVIKALEHCESSCSSEACVGCPFDEKGACTEAENALAIFALDLIKRQKAEIAYWMDEAANAKKEAVKGFAERLKERSCFYDHDDSFSFRAVLVEDIENLAKEMTGVKE